MSWSDIRDWVGIAVAGVPFAWLCLDKLVKKSFATTEDTRALATALPDTEAALQRQIDEERHERKMLAKDVANLPDQSTIKTLDNSMRKLELAVERLTTEVSNVGDKAEERSAAIKRIEDYLLSERTGR